MADPMLCPRRLESDGWTPSTMSGCCFCCCTVHGAAGSVLSLSAQSSVPHRRRAVTAMGRCSGPCPPPPHSERACVCFFGIHVKFLLKSSPPLKKKIPADAAGRSCDTAKEFRKRTCLPVCRDTEQSLQSFCLEVEIMEGRVCMCMCQCV